MEANRCSGLGPTHAQPETFFLGVAPSSVKDQRILSVLGYSFCSCPTLSVLYPILSCLALVAPLHIHRWAQGCLVVAGLVFVGLCGHFVQCVATGLALGMPGHVCT